MTLAKTPMFNIVQNNALDVLRVADFHRRRTHSISQTHAIGQFNKVLLRFAEDLVTHSNPDRQKVARQAEAYLGKNFTERAGKSRIVSINADILEDVKLMHNMRTDLMRMIEFSESTGAEKIILPIKARSLEAYFINQVIREYTVPKMFILRDKPYEEDLSIYGPINPHVEHNFLSTDIIGRNPVIDLLDVSIPLLAKWRTELYAEVGKNASVPSLAPIY